MAKVWQGEVDRTLLIVRCKGKRIFAVVDGDPEAIIVHAQRGTISDFILVGNRIDGRMHKRLTAKETILDCPIHSAGHDIDGTKLRQVIDIRCRRGKIINEDIERVVTINP